MTAPIIYVGPGEAGELMVITEESHDECGWPERITYYDADGKVVRAGCAGCEAEFVAAPDHHVSMIARMLGPLRITTTAERVAEQILELARRVRTTTWDGVCALDERVRSYYSRWGLRRAELVPGSEQLGPAVALEPSHARHRKES